jgi:hypothetical protein
MNNLFNRRVRKALLCLRFEGKERKGHKVKFILAFLCDLCAKSLRTLWLKDFDFYYCNYFSNQALIKIDFINNGKR